MASTVATEIVFLCAQYQNLCANAAAIAVTIAVFISVARPLPRLIAVVCVTETLASSLPSR